MTRVGVLGAGGRMGQAIIAALAEAPGLKLGGAVERAGHAIVGTKLGAGLIVCSNPLALAHSCDVLIDFTTPEALAANLEAACESKTPLVVGTTGLEAKHHKAIDAAARDVAILQTGNTSLGVNLLAALVEQAAAKLGDDWDIEIVEMHHRMKVDAPSGTAVLLGEAAAAGREVDLAQQRVAVRDGHTGARVPGTIGFATLRGGTVVGDHKVVFAGAGERLELAHVAEDRGLFAQGAVKAALWSRGRAPGLYSMADVLGLDGL
ncbi:MAG: 4-hydroxy-tetrahydrodipicolinate reductase [Sphingomonadaceae bacterium]|nr:4-hydroxy-tetrahydrodipicolinate reductase [Sphingomonadaceae bacterium]